MPLRAASLPAHAHVHAYAQTQLSGSLPAVLTDAPATRFYAQDHRRGNTTDEFFALTGGRIGRNFHRVFQQTLGKVLESHRLPALPKRAGSVYASAFRQQYVRYPERSPYPAYGLLRRGSAFQPRGNRSSLLFMYCSRRPVVATTMSWFSLNTSAWFI